MKNTNWTQFGDTYTYTPSSPEQIYVNHSFGAVPSNATRVCISTVQEGDIETFVEIYKGHSTAIYEFSQTVSLANWQDNNTVRIGYIKFANVNKITIKAYYK